MSSQSGENDGGRLNHCGTGLLAVSLPSRSCSLHLLGFTGHAATTSSSRVPRCPPDCGAVAAGDPLLVPFMTQNPGLDWQAFPAATSQAYVDSLRPNTVRLAGRSTTTNVAAARWEWVNIKYRLLITLIASNSIWRKSTFRAPWPDAADICESAGGTPRGSPAEIPGIPGSVSASCRMPPKSSVKDAVAAAFIRGNVAVLIDVSSPSNGNINPQHRGIACSRAVCGTSARRCPRLERWSRHRVGAPMDLHPGGCLAGSGRMRSSEAKLAWSL